MELQNIFTTVLNMTVTGSVVIGCVLPARLILSRAPKLFSCLLWLVVLFRLLCPVSVAGPASVLELVKAPEVTGGAVVYLEMPVQAPLETIRVTPDQHQAPADTSAAFPAAESPVDWNLLGSRVWLAGAAVALGCGVFSYVNLKRRLRESVSVGRGIREADGIAAPFVLGLLRPVIYLPAKLSGAERAYILLHEQLHIRHADHLVKGLLWLAVCVHWFNPLVWLAFYLCGRDMELRCDEAVLKRLGGDLRSDYAQSLLDFSARHIAPAPLAFGEGNTGKRVKFVLKWKKRKGWMAIPAAVLCAAVLVLTACNPKAPGKNGMDSPFGHHYKATTVVPTRYDEPVEQEWLITLTGDMALLLQSGGETTQLGAFKELKHLPIACAACPDPLEWTMLKADTAQAWEAIEHGTDHFLLLQQEDGTLYLLQSGQQYLLERTDLLGVTIHQSGKEAQIEPVWCQPGDEGRYLDTLSTTPVDGEAEILLTLEKDMETIQIYEEYYEVLSENGENRITRTECVPERNGNGTFTLTVSRRGAVGDDHALYRVVAGEDQYLFRLTFVAVPLETAVGAFDPEQTHPVTFSDSGAVITLSLPEGWEYAFTSTQEDAYNAGIDFWPLGREEGKLHFGYYPHGFGVCGTGLETEAATLAGQEATVGTYDGGPLWTYICFNEHFAVRGTGHEAWWSEYGGQAMKILNTAQFGLE